MNVLELAEENPASTPLAQCEATSSKVETHSLSVARLPRDLITQWERLFRSAAGARPHHDPQVVLIEAQAALAAGLGSGQVIVLNRGGQLRALAALLPKRVPLSGPQRLLGRSLRGYWLAGGSMLAAEPADQVSLARALPGVLRETRADLMVIDDLEADSALWRELEILEVKGFRRHLPSGLQPRRKIQMPQCAAQYYEKFTAKTRSKFKRVIRKLGDVQVVRITEPDQIPYFLEQAHEVSRNSWQARQIGLRVCKSDRECALYERLATIGVFRSYLLEQDARPVAFCIAFQHQGRFILDEIGYDLAYNQQSPGQVLQLKMLDDLFTYNRPTLVDFGGGDAEYKRLFSNDATTGATVWMLRPGLRTCLLRAMLAVQSRAAKAARRMLECAGLFRQLRQRYRFKVQSAVARPAEDAEVNDA